jgi:hypothetical protein
LTVATNNLQVAFSLGSLDVRRSDGGTLYLTSVASYDPRFHEPPNLLAGLDLDAAWKSASAFLRGQGEDVGNLLQLAGVRVDAWREVGGIQHLIGGSLGEDEVRKLQN